MMDLERDTSIVGPVDLRVPADPAMSKVLRLAASGVASLAGFSVEEIEEIKLAVSETMIALVEHGAGLSIDIRFVIGRDDFTVQGSTPIGPTFDSSDADLALCRVVLDEICSSHAIEVTADKVRIGATLQRPFPGL